MSALDYRVHMLEAAVRQLQAERDGDEKVKRYRAHVSAFNQRAREFCKHWKDPPHRPTLGEAPRNDERMSVYHSSTGERVPLSFASRHLMQDLRDAATDSIADGHYNNRLVNARLALAKRISELEIALASRPKTPPGCCGGDNCSECPR